MNTNISIKISLRNKPNKEGLCPVIMRVIKDRKAKIITLKMDCYKKDWDETNAQYKKGSINHVQRNRLLLKYKEKAFKIVDTFNIEGVDFTLNQFEDKFRNKGDKPVTVKTFWEETINDLIKSGRTGNAMAHKDTMQSFFKFHQNDTAMFREINAELLAKYEVYLRSTGSQDGGIRFKMRELRALFNDAIRKDIVDEKCYPFKLYKISKLRGKPHKRALTRDEIRLIENLDEEKYPGLVESKKLFVFSYYTRGMNFYDIMKLKWANVEGDYIVYTRSKTKGNFNIKILQPVKEILDLYKLKGNSTSYIFPILLKEDLTPMQIENRKAKKLKKFNKDLQKIAEVVGIDKKVTSYVARHSFATNLREVGVNTDIISQSMGHQNVSITIAYLKDLSTDVIDNANELLLSEPIPIYSTNTNLRLTAG